MKVALVEAFFTGSHKRWAEELQHFSLRQIDIFSLKGNYWKWRMHGGAISLAKTVILSLNSKTASVLDKATLPAPMIRNLAPLILRNSGKYICFFRKDCDF